MNFAKYRFKIVKFMIFITFRNLYLVSITLRVKSLTVIPKFVEFTRVPEAVVQKCSQNLQKTPKMESLFNIVTSLRCFNFEKYFKNVYL